MNCLLLLLSALPSSLAPLPLLPPPFSPHSEFCTLRPALGSPPSSLLPPPSSSLPPGFARLAAFRLHSSPAAAARPLPAAFPDSTLYVGLSDTLETLAISGLFEHSGDIVVLNRGTLILDHCDFRLRGNLYVYNSGTALIDGGRFFVGQQFAYEFTSGVMGDGAIVFDSASADFNGWSWSMLVADSARLSVERTTLRNGFATIVPVARANVEYSHADFASEFVIFDSCRVSITNCDTVLPWLNFPEGSTADLTLAEPDTTILHWELSPSTPGVTGIGYTLTLDTVSSVLWGCFPLPGSNVTFTDSRLRSTGLIIPGSDSITFNGLVNNQHYADYTLPLADRSFRLINTDLTTWNLYPGGNTDLVLNSCVFGEILAQDSSRATVQNSICDGSGGYIGSEASSTLLFLGCLVTTQVVSRDRSLMLGGLSTVMYGPVTSTDGSAMLLLFCNTERDPQARDTSLLYICDYSIPGNATVDESLAIVGTVDIRPGPENPLGFGSYRFSYASADTPTTWHDIGTRHYSPVVSDTLEIWDTHGLVPGQYLLKLTIANSGGDSLEPTRAVFLGYAGLEDVAGPAQTRPALEVSPNPSPGRVSIDCAPQLQQAGLVRLFAPSGRLCGTHQLTPGSPLVLTDLAAGVYLLKLSAGELNLSRKLVVQR